MKRRLPLPLSIVVAALGVLVAGCGSSEQSSAPDSKSLSFKITDGGCEPHDAKVAAGPVNFEVESEGSSVTEIEVVDSEAILGEKDNMADGLKGGFSLNLEAGESTLRGNGGAEEDGTLTVRGKLKGTSSPKVEAAIASYRGYLEENAAGLVAATKPFAAAVVSP
jgi:iron uptake system EfeUOB component EfeO/EfeM